MTQVALDSPPSIFVPKLEIKPLGSQDSGAWEEYVQDHPDATMFHPLLWSAAVQSAYGHEPMHLVAWRGGHVVGVLPLSMVKSLFVGKVLVSVACATYGGILADSGDIARALAQAAQNLCHDLGAQYLELRHREPVDTGFAEVGQYVTFRKLLPTQVNDVLPSLPRKARAAARAGLDAFGPEAVLSGPEHLGDIHYLYALTMRRLGSPSHRWSFFVHLAELFGDDCVCLLLRRNGRPVAGVVSFLFRDEIVPYFSGSTQEGMECNANNVMYLRLMEYAVLRGLRWFDFNRSRRDNPGPYHFKIHQGFDPQPLHYQVCLLRRSEAPNLTPGNPKLALAQRVWRRLPLRITRSAGGMIWKWIP